MAICPKWAQQNDEEIPITYLALEDEGNTDLPVREARPARPDISNE